MNRLKTFRVRLKQVLTVLPVALLLALGIVGSIVPQPAYAASSSVPEMISSAGKDFWVTFMYNFGKDDDNCHMKLYAIALENAVVQVKEPSGTLLYSKTVSAGDSLLYEVDRSKVYITSSGKKESKSVHVVSTGNIALYQSNEFDNGDRKSVV